MLNQLQQYMVCEFVDDYRAGYLSRRDLVRRVLNITGGVGSTATLLLALGCTAQPAAAPTSAAAPTAKPAAASSPVAIASPAASPAVSPKPAAAASPSASPVAAASPGVGSGVPGAQSPLSIAANDPSINGQDIAFSGAGGANILAYQARPANASRPLPLVLVCHENRGLTEHIRDVVRRFAKEGFIACGVDLVSRQGGTASITDLNQFSALLTGPNVDQDQFVGDFASAVAFYKTKPDLVLADKMAMNGY